MRSHRAARFVRTVTTSRPWRSLRSTQLVHRIRHSLSAKLALAITAAALVILLVFGVIVASQLRTSMFETRRDAILADASLRFSSAQSVFSSSTATSADQVQESARGALASLKASAAGAGATNVALLRAEGSTASLRINQVEDEQMRGLITPQMREAVAGGGAQWQSVAIRSSTTDKVSPGILVGTQVQLPRAGAHELYILYSLEADQSQVDVVLRVLALTSLPIILALPIGVFALLHRLLLPVRLTVHAATRAAEGDLDVRVEVHGADEMAALGRAFNAMTSSLQDTITRYDELAKLQQRFVSDVSHELRTPLASIRLATEQIQDAREEISDPFALRSIQVLSSSVDRFETMLTDLLDISRIDSGNVKLRLEEIDLAQVVDTVIETTQFHFDATGTELRLHLPEEPATAEIDVTRVERIIRNLVVNALEHGEGKPMDVTVAVDADAVAVRVRDHGIGMSPDVVTKVFDRFYRADPSRKRSLGGTGLGLSIAMEDARLHGGRLSAWGWPADGSSFLLVLPRTQGADGGPGRLSGPGPLELVPQDAPAVARAGIPVDEESSFSPVGPLGPAPATRRARQSVVLGDIPLAGESHDAVTEDVGRVVVVLPGQEPATRTPEETEEEGWRR